MRNISTYNLKEQGNSAKYYKDISQFTNLVIKKIKDEFSNYITEYSFYHKLDEPKYMNEEKCLELLTWAIYFNNYNTKAHKSNRILENILLKLKLIRKKYSHMKKVVDPICGLVITINELLSHFINRDTKAIKVSHKRLLTWLESTGEFEQEVKRIEKWYAFYLKLNEENKEEFNQKLISLAVWFENNSKLQLGNYTSKVESFLSNNNRNWLLNENQYFIHKKRVEYHLNMVGAEILNQVYKSDFQKVENKIILLPKCMKIDKRNCQAKKQTIGKLCMGCNQNCNINIIKNQAAQYNYKTIVVGHESSLADNKKIKRAFGDKSAIIGVACILHLINGGWKLKNANIPAQCVLLNYSGCKKHWREKDIPTEINLDSLRNIMENNKTKKKGVKNEYYSNIR